MSELPSSDLNTRRYKAVCEVVGDIVIRWGKIETLVDGVVQACQKFWDKQGVQADKRITNFKTSLGHVRTFFDEHQIFSFAGEFYAELFDELENLYAKRNLIAHGILSYDDNGTITLRKPSRDRHAAFEKEKMSWEQLLELRRKIDRALKKVYELSELIWEPIDKNLGIIGTSRSS